ncbi:hypothetical protein M231_06718 [Tremella mesenterica]|uniref:Uncharacterized protein n=1 Tax=Tremella mesenterica TaxID=5217 RepID=A0A4Q1BDL9_TREME|nr:hypothetical protein M231_06718 [Tremella mesenterica]
MTYQTLFNIPSPLLFARSETTLISLGAKTGPLYPTTMERTKLKGIGSGQPGYHQWEQRHTEALVQGIIEVVSTYRVAIYARPGLSGEVDGHGSDRIRQKLDQVLKKLAREYGMEADLGARKKTDISPGITTWKRTKDVQVGMKNLSGRSKPQMIEKKVNVTDSNGKRKKGNEYELGRSEGQDKKFKKE